MGKKYEEFISKPVPENDIGRAELPTIPHPPKKDNETTNTNQHPKKTTILFLADQERKWTEEKLKRFIRALKYSAQLKLFSATAPTRLPPLQETTQICEKTKLIVLPVVR